MITGQIANGFITVGIRGLAAAQAQLAKLAKNVTDFTGEAVKAGVGASVAFATATASIRQLVQAADPLGFRQYEMAVARLNVQMGRIFIPILREVTGLITQLTGWFRGLSDSTRETVMSVTRVALALLGVAAAATTASLFITGVVGPFARLIPLALTVAKALAGVFLVANWPLLIAGAAAALAVFVAWKAAGEDFGNLWDGITYLATAAWEAIKTAWGGLVAFFGPLLDKLGAAFGKSWHRISTLVSNSLKRLEPLLGLFGGKAEGLLGGGLAVLAKLVTAGFEGLGKVIEWTADVLEAVWPTVEVLTAAFLVMTAATIDGLQEAGKWIASTWDAALEKTGEFIAWCGTAFDRIVKLGRDIATTVSDAFAPVWPDIKRGFQGVGDYIMGVFRRVRDEVNKLIDGMIDSVNKLIDSLNAGFVGRNIATISPLPTRQQTQPRPPETPTPNKPSAAGQPFQPAAPGRVASDIDRAVVEQDRRIIKTAPEPYAFSALGGALAPHGYLGDTVQTPALNPLVPKVEILSTNQGQPKAAPVNQQAPTFADLSRSFVALIAEGKHMLAGAVEMKALEQQAKDRTPFDSPAKPGPNSPEETSTAKPEAGGFLAALKGFLPKNKPGAPQEGKYQGQPLQEVKILGIAESLRAAQTSTVPTAQQAQMDEILSTAKAIRANTEKTADNTGMARPLDRPATLVR